MLASDSQNNPLLLIIEFCMAAIACKEHASAKSAFILETATARLKPCPFKTCRGEGEL